MVSEAVRRMSIGLCKVISMIRGKSVHAINADRSGISKLRSN